MNVSLLLLLLLSIVATISINALESSRPCRRVQFKYGINCECTESYCDTLNIPLPKNENEFVFVTSSEDGERFSYKNGNFSTEKTSNFNSDSNIFSINQEIIFNRSEILGFGGAWTGAVRHILSEFSPKLREHFYKSYFSMEDGIGYNLLRISIGGVDFDIEPWTYNMQTNPDPQLFNFTQLNKYDKLQNSQINEMRKIANNSVLKVLAAAWSPPLWMKANHEWYASANNRLMSKYYKAFADYHARWLNLTKEDGIPVFSISTGNEPDFSLNFVCGQIGHSWDPENQADWMVNYLAPSLQQTGLDVKIHVYDDVRNGSMEYLGNMTNREADLMKFTDFIALHPYFDSISSPEILDSLHQLYNKPILYNEMSFGVTDLSGMKLGSWSRAEELITLLMDALQHDVAGYVDWNLILDSNSGPSYSGHITIDAFLVANEEFTAFYKQPLYYAMGHFAKFIPRHSMRINTTFTGPNVSQIQTIAYHRPDKKVAIIFYNKGKSSINIKLVDMLNGRTQLTVAPKSLNTIIYSVK